jgi:hypothetical protein
MDRHRKPQTRSSRALPTAQATRTSGVANSRRPWPGEQVVVRAPLRQRIQVDPADGVAGEGQSATPSLKSGWDRIQKRTLRSLLTWDIMANLRQVATHILNLEVGRIKKEIGANAAFAPGEQSQHRIGRREPVNEPRR